MAGQQRIISLLPSTTEIVAALGLQNQLVGRSHECDYPAKVETLPICTEPKFNPSGQSYEIDERVKALLQEGLSVYRVDADQLAQLNPDIIITQDHCEVCAASVDEVKQATRQQLGNDVEIVSVSPTNLSEVYESIRQIAGAVNSEKAGEELVQQMRNELADIQEHTSSFDTPTMLCIEWIEPLMTAGNWVPELANTANVKTLAAEAGKHSPWIDWEQVLDLNPEFICIMPCGYSIKESMNEMETLTSRREWSKLQAVQNNKVFIADGHHYFNRPGPRLTKSARILAEIAHPKLENQLKGKGWINFYEHIAK